MESHTFSALKQKYFICLAKVINCLFDICIQVVCHEEKKRINTFTFGSGRSLRNAVCCSVRVDVAIVVSARRHQKKAKFKTDFDLKVELFHNPFLLYLLMKFCPVKFLQNCFLSDLEKPSSFVKL